MRGLKVGVAQYASTFEQRSTLSIVEKATGEAKENGVGLLLFPEAFIGGYPRGSAFGSKVGGRSEAGRDEYLHYHNAAVDLRPESWERLELERISKYHGIFLAVGCIERASSLYCTVVYIDPVNGYVGKHRKIMPVMYPRMYL